MAKKIRRVTDDELKVIVDAEIASAMGFLGGDLSSERKRSMDRYLGEPLGTEMEGRSRVQTRDVMDVIEWILPSLIRIFTDTDQPVKFAAVGPEDEAQAEQETDYINHLFMQKNNGFLILYCWFKDALLQKNGTVKSYVEDEDRTTRETYRNLSDESFNVLMADKEYELIEHDTETMASDMGGEITLHNATFLHKDTYRKICIDNIPPEEFLISQDARTVDPRQARFSAHRTDISSSDLREMGYSESDIEKMEDGPRLDITEESLARYNLSDEQDIEVEKLNEAMRTKRVYECYLKADRDGDGIAESLKVLRSGDFIEVEECDGAPFDSLTPIILTHKFYGLSVGDIIYDLQEIRSTLLRSYFDNVYQMINGTVYYDENLVNIDDMLTSKPYGIRAVNGSPQTSVMHVNPSGLPAEAFSLFELTDAIKQQRIGDFQSQIDPSQLANTQTGVVIRLIGEAKAKTEMIARIFAETGVKSMFRYLHELTRKYSDRQEMVKLRNQWVPVDPRQWRERTDLKVRVGLGNESKEERMANAMDLLNMQERVVTSGGMGSLVTPNHIYQALVEYTKAQGRANPERYWQNPATAQPPPPPPPDPQLLLIQAQKEIEQLKLYAGQQKLMVEDQRARREEQLKAAEIQQRSAEIAQANQIKEMQIELQRIKDAAAITNDSTKNVIAERTMQIENQLKAVQQVIDDRNERQSHLLEKYAVDMQANTAILTSQAKDVAMGESNKTNSMLLNLSESVNKLGEMIAEGNKPKKIERDDKGRIIAIGAKKVMRDASGAAIGIE